MAMTEEQKAARDAFRSATLGAPAIRRSMVVEWNGQKAEVRRPSIERQLYIDKVTAQADGTIDKRKQLFLGLIGCVFLPGTDIQMWEVADEAVIMSRDMDDFVGFFMRKLGELNAEVTMESVEKNSDSGATV
jgi:hypothetical protein